MCETNKYSQSLNPRRLLSLKRLLFIPQYRLGSISLWLLVTLILLLTATLTIADEAYNSDQHKFKLTTITDGLEHPWGLAFLPNGDVLITERVGHLRIARAGQLDAKPISGLPKNIYAEGQGGLLDVAIHPEFATNNLVYISYAGRGKGGAGTGWQEVDCLATTLKIQKPFLWLSQKPRAFFTMVLD